MYDGSRGIDVIDVSNTNEQVGDDGDLIEVDGVHTHSELNKSTVPHIYSDAIDYAEDDGVYGSDGFSQQHVSTGSSSSVNNVNQQSSIPSTTKHGKHQNHTRRNISQHSVPNTDQNEVLQQSSNVSLRRSTRVRSKPIPHWDVSAVEASKRNQVNIGMIETLNTDPDMVDDRMYNANSAEVALGDVGDDQTNVQFDGNNDDLDTNTNTNTSNNDLSTISLDNLNIGNEPTTYTQAIHSDDCIQWEKAMQEEYDSILSCGTWSLVKLPPNSDRQAIGCKWVYKIKRKADGSVERYKARLVAKGFNQKEGIDYNETFAPVAKFCSIRALLALAAREDMEIHQMDVKTAFLNGDLDEDIYMKQPQGYVVDGKEDYVCKLHKALYGLKQAGRAWYKKIDNVLLHTLGFKRSQADHCVYVYNGIGIVDDNDNDHTNDNDNTNDNI